MSKVALYTAYHKPSPKVESESIHPIHVGRAAAHSALPGMIGDDTGESISERNSNWCELTALYWAWKNDRESDVIGLMHYRRLLDVQDKESAGEVEKAVGFIDLRDWCRDTEAWLAEHIQDYDIILPRPHRMGRSVEQNYRRGHAEQDWDIMCEIVRRDYPEYTDSLREVASGHSVRLGNIAVMQRPIFDRYCEWMFDILFKVEAREVDRDFYSVQQARYLGFLSERLLTVFVHHEMKRNPALRVREVSILNLSEAVIAPYVARGEETNPTAINIALATDRGYLPHAAAMLRTVMDNLTPDRPLEVFLLHSGIDARDIFIFESMLAARANTHLHAINTGGFFDDSYRSSSRAPSNATYNRFLLFKLLPGLDRVLYLDCDMIVCRDIAELFDTPMGDAQLAAVPDWIMTRTLTGPTPTIDPNVPDLAEYHRSALGLSDEQIARYFNAGVLLFNFAAMKNLAAQGETLLVEAKSGKYLFRDQDILNRHFKEDLLELDARWNVFNSIPAAYNRVPKNLHAKAMSAKSDPWIVHYADGAYKPWKNRAVPWAELYWGALVRTPFFSEVVKARSTAVGRPKGSTRVIVKAGRALADRVPVLRGPLLWIYAKLRDLKG